MSANFGLRVVGDSMVGAPGGPSYPHGAIIVVDPTLEAEPGDDVVVELSGGVAMVKRLELDGGKQMLRSLNTKYPITAMPVGAHITGVVVQIQIEVRR
jgi:SOS-response transcriptional repressor LexA